MMTLQFFGQNIHFAVNLFAALVFGAMAWLYMDAWGSRKELKELFKWVGYLALAFGFLISGTVVEGSTLFQSTLAGVTSYLPVVLKVLGFLILAVGFFIDPLPKLPDTKNMVSGNQPAKTHSHKKQHHAVYGTFVGVSLQWLLPIGSGLVGWLYWHRSTKGLERHLRAVAIGFFIITISQAISLSSMWRESTNPALFNLVATYGIVWFIQQLLLLVGVLVLARWVWSYLIKRFFSQLFMVFIGVTVSVFLVTTVSFSYLLTRNIQADTLDSLETAVKSLKYAIDGKQLETLSSAEVIGQNPQVVEAILAKDYNRLVELSGNYMSGKKLSSVIITNESGQVLVRGEDPERWGDSISDDVMVQRATSGLSSSSMVSKQDVIAPLVYFQSSIPVSHGGQIIGTVIVGVIADNAFVDGIKQATGLDSTVYSGNVRSATTFVAPDGKSRWVGVKETNKQVKDKVLENGQTFKGAINILNQPYLAVYAPLKDFDSDVVGMLFVGRPQAFVLNTADRSIELTFVITALLLMMSIYPAYAVAKYIESQLS